MKFVGKYIFKMPTPRGELENTFLLRNYYSGNYHGTLLDAHGGVQVAKNIETEGDILVFPELSICGYTVADMLQYVQLDPNTLLTQFRDQVKNTGLDDALQQQFLEEFEAGLYGYTYLEDE